MIKKFHDCKGHRVLSHHSEGRSWHRSLVQGGGLWGGRVAWHPRQNHRPPVNIRPGISRGWGGPDIGGLALPRHRLSTNLSIVVVASPTGKRPVPIGCKRQYYQNIFHIFLCNGNWKEENKALWVKSAARQIISWSAVLKCTCLFLPKKLKES